MGYMAVTLVTLLDLLCGSTGDTSRWSVELILIFGRILRKHIIRSYQQETWDIVVIVQK